MDKDRQNEPPQGGNSQLSSEELAWRFASGEITPAELSLAKSHAVNDPAFKELLLSEIAFESLIALAGEEAASLRQAPWACEEVRRHANAWRAHELDPSSSAAIAAHLSQCSRCEQALAAPAVAGPGRNHMGGWTLLAASALVVAGAFLGARFLASEEDNPPRGHPEGVASPADDTSVEMSNSTTRLVPAQPEKPLPKRHTLLNAYGRPAHIVWPNLSIDTLTAAMKKFADFSVPRAQRSKRAVVHALGENWQQKVQEAIDADLVFAKLGQEAGLNRLEGEQRTLAHFFLSIANHPHLDDRLVATALSRLDRLTGWGPELIDLALQLGLNTDSESLFSTAQSIVYVSKTLSPEFLQEYYNWALAKAYEFRWSQTTQQILAREGEGRFVATGSEKAAILNSPDPVWAAARATIARNMLRSGSNLEETLGRLYESVNAQKVDHDRATLLVMIARETADARALKALQQIVIESHDPLALSTAKSFLQSKEKLK